jgi:tetratricopeptide (TPR) repeat protein
MTQELRCLSIRQPWAWAIAAGLKDIENRSWTTEYRGPIVIHAGANKTVVSRLLKGADADLPTITFAYSALVGVADVVDVVPLSAELEDNPWAWGPYCWRIANPRCFAEPIAAKGRLNLYALREELAQRVREALPHAEGLRRDRRVSAWASYLVGRFDEGERLAGLFDSYLQLGDGENALRLAERSVVLHGDADAYVDRAVAKALLAAPDYQGALVDLDRAIEADHLSGRAHRVRSLVHRELGMADRAEADLARAKELGFDDGGTGDGATDEDA